MSLLRNFSPGGSEPEDDEQPTTTAQQGEQPAMVQPDETASGGGHVPGTARYAFAGPSAGAAPAPAAVVPSEVVTEPDESARDDLALDEPAPLGEPAPETAPVPVAAAADRETTAPDLETPVPDRETPVPDRETPVPDRETPVPDRETPVAQDPPGPVFRPYAETAAPATASVPPLQTTPAPVPSPRAADEDALVAPAAPERDFAAPLLGDAAELRARWQRVQGDFVDDPRAAVSSAADLVGQTGESLMEALRQRQQQLRTLWERGADGSPAAATAPDTEELRLMMQRYRALFNELCRPS